MKRLLPLVLLGAVAAEPQNAPMEKPCIAFSQESDSPTNVSAKAPLEAAVMKSGDFDFYPSRHDGCWTVHVLSLPINNAKGKAMGYAISQTVTDPESVEVGHALTFGPGREIFVRAMNRAVADAIRSIRVARAREPRNQLR
jgi:hypothetical protein